MILSLIGLAISVRAVSDVAKRTEKISKGKGRKYNKMYDVKPRQKKRKTKGYSKRYSII